MTSTKELKEQGKKCVEEGKYAEAMLHYTYAIKQDPNQYELYSNRSLAFLKLEQYYYAIDDAKQCIKLRPNWSKGYYRKGQVEYETGHYEEALISYKEAMKHHEGNDSLIAEAIKKTHANLYKQQSNDIQVPWVAAGLGLVLGIGFVVADYIILVNDAFFHNPLFKVGLIVIFAVLFFYGARYQRKYYKKSRDNLLSPPIDLFGDDT